MEDTIFYLVNKSFLHDIGITLTHNAIEAVAIDQAITKDSLVKCEVCSTKLKLKKMRKHI